MTTWRRFRFGFRYRFNRNRYASGSHIGRVHMRRRPFFFKADNVGSVFCFRVHRRPYGNFHVIPLNKETSYEADRAENNSTGRRRADSAGRTFILFFRLFADNKGDR